MMSRNLEMVPVVSSSLSAVGHDGGADELHVQFKNGSRYVYSGVSAEKHGALIAADSVGKHFAANIRKKYPARRL
jgi:hypothetical protein